MSQVKAIVAAVVLLGLIGGTAVYTMIHGRSQDDRFARCKGGSVAGGALGGPFTLVNGQGQMVTDADVITKPSLIYFGYTFCPDVCPFDNARTAAALTLLEEQGVDAQGVFISIDPERDTPEVVEAFAANLHPKYMGLTGSDEQVAAASKAYRTFYKKDASGDPDYYLVDHSTFTYLVLPDHGFVDFYRREVTPEEMAKSVSCFVDGAT